jgi:hypothetical protein
MILEFGLKKPAYRIVVNTPTTHGSIGLTTGLDPSMTLGCGGYGGNITSDNISPKHLLNIKRVAYELRPAQVPKVPSVPEVPRAGFEKPVPSPPGLPRVREKPAPEPISSDTLTSRIDKFLETRGLVRTKPLEPLERLEPLEPSKPAEPEQFVCEEDVRLAVKNGRKLLISERTIVTPAARDAGEAARVFVHVGWPS